MNRRVTFLLSVILLGLLLTACGSGTPGGVRTPIPTLTSATPPGPGGPGVLAAMVAQPHCTVRAVDLIGAWVKVGSPETNAFDFTDAFGKACTATFVPDIQVLFNQSNVWFKGALACAACHGPDLAGSYALMNLSDYQGVTSGSRRQSADAKGNDILGGGDWEKSRLYQMLTSGAMPPGRPGPTPEKGPLVPAGKPK
jgi:hypothetical protein